VVLEVHFQINLQKDLLLLLVVELVELVVEEFVELVVVDLQN
jgi:hypothetical protein